MELEFHLLDLRYERLRVRRPMRERRLLASLAERGQQVPVVVIAIPEETDRFIVIDGYKRIRALSRLGRDTVRATVWDMSETEALILDRSLRTAEGETALEQGWLLSELHRSFNLSLHELAMRFDRSASWVSRRLALVRELPAVLGDPFDF
jgi:ParB family chromosome partitioning protein